ncbi:MAG: PQQ-binding-like beta-propeller repeat protein [Alphaproteobacteria bacterium]
MCQTTIPRSINMTKCVEFGRILTLLLATALLTAAASAETPDWPQFHGPGRDAMCSETGLMKSWPEGGPKLLWKIEGLGKGFSTVSIAGGKIFTMGDLERDGDESQYVIVYDLETRRELWATRVGPPHSDGPRCTPTVDGELLYAIGTSGDLACLETETGKVVWKKNFERDFDGRMMSGWKYSESPLVDGQKLVCTPGGRRSTMVALDKKTGDVIWRCAIPKLGDRGKDGAAYSSMVVSEACGVRQYVQIIGRGAVGVAAEDGKFLWGYNPVANGVANISSPVVRGDYAFVTTSYRTGSALLKLTRSGSGVKAEEVYFLGPTQFENHHGGVLLVGDYIYGGHLKSNGTPVCVELLTGKIVWKEKALARGSAAVLYADGHMIWRYESGPVFLVEATPEEFRIKGRLDPITGGGPAWPHPVIHDGKLYLRHRDVLGCYDVRGT